MSNLLQQVPKLLQRRGPWPASESIGGDNSSEQPESDVTAQVRPESQPSSPAGYNPYWDLPPS